MELDPSLLPPRSRNEQRRDYHSVKRLLRGARFVLVRVLAFPPCYRLPSASLSIFGVFEAVSEVKFKKRQGPTNSNGTKTSRQTTNNNTNARRESHPLDVVGSPLPHLPLVGQVSHQNVHEAQKLVHESVVVFHRDLQRLAANKRTRWMAVEQRDEKT